LKLKPEAIEAAEGKVVKIISALLQHLPETHEYRVVFMIRPLEEVVASQNRMLERLGRDVPRTPNGLGGRSVSKTSSGSGPLVFEQAISFRAAR
jgi:hypothetical protein